MAIGGIIGGILTPMYKSAYAKDRGETYTAKDFFGDFFQGFFMGASFAFGFNLLGMFAAEFLIAKIMLVSLSGIFTLCAGGQAYYDFKNGHPLLGTIDTVFFFLGVKGTYNSAKAPVGASANADKPTVSDTSNVKNGNGYKAPKVFRNSKGQLTNGTYTVDSVGMEPHTNGLNSTGKSQFMYGVDANKAVLDAAAYADEFNLWTMSDGSKARVPVANGPVGIHGSSGLQTDYINVYRTKTGFVHGAPASPG